MINYVIHTYVCRSDNSFIHMNTRCFYLFTYAAPQNSHKYAAKAFPVNVSSNIVVMDLSLLLCSSGMCVSMIHCQQCVCVCVRACVRVCVYNCVSG